MPMLDTDAPWMFMAWNSRERRVRSMSRAAMGSDSRFNDPCLEERQPRRV